MADNTAGVNPVCAFCGSSEVTRVALFGGQLMTSQYRCRACLTYFEQIRWEDDNPAAKEDRPAVTDVEGKGQGG